MAGPKRAPECVRRAVCAALAFGVVTLVSAATPQAEYHEGEAYAVGSERLLYRESHWLRDERGATQRIVLYRCPDGSAFARKRVDATPGALAPDFDFEDARSGRREGVRTRDGKREVYFIADAASAERSAPLGESALVIDAGFDAFVVSEWDALATGAKVPLEFLVPSRLSPVAFEASASHRADATGLRRFHLAIASWYGFALPRVDVAYDETTRTLREFRGPGTIRDHAGGPLDVRIEFPPGLRRAAIHADEIERAEQDPLAGRCATD